MKIEPAFQPIENSLYESREEYFSGRNLEEEKPNIKLYNLIKSVTVNILISLVYLNRNHGYFQHSNYLQILLVVLSAFKRINYLLLLLKSSENQ